MEDILGRVGPALDRNVELNGRLFCEVSCFDTDSPPGVVIREIEGIACQKGYRSVDGDHDLLLVRKDRVFSVNVTGGDDLFPTKVSLNYLCDFEYS